MPDEKWLPVVGYEGSYEVSDQGRVRSLDRVVPVGTTHVRRLKSQVLAPRNDRCGHLRVALWHEGHQVSYYVHTLLLAAFVGPRPEGMVCRHLNGIPDDNRPENLAWGTPSENQFDRVRHGTHTEARKTHCSRGHEYSPENTYRTTKGKAGGYTRICKKCHLAGHRRRYAEKRAAANAAQSSPVAS